MATVLYARVSTSDQTIAHQRTQAEEHGFEIDLVIEDNGVSGVNTRLADRPGGRRLFDVLRKGDTLVVRWIDRLGRNYEDVCDNIREFVRRGIVIRTVISNFTFDGTTRDPMQKAIRDALIGFMAAMGEAQAEATKLAMQAGIAKAKAEDAERERGERRHYMGRKPSFDRKQLDAVRDLLGQGLGISETAKGARVSRQTVYRIQADPAGAEAALTRWGG
jgi:putative DNA-invertase from lambdoid prophage Rac